METGITDEDYIRKSTKLKTHVTFNRNQLLIGDVDVDVFFTKIDQKEFIKPEHVTESAMRFYREVKRMDIQEEELVFFRVHTTENTAVWIMPFMGDLVAWSRYERVQF